MSVFRPWLTLIVAIGGCSERPIYLPAEASAVDGANLLDLSLGLGRSLDMKANEDLQIDLEDLRALEDLNVVVDLSTPADLSALADLRQEPDLSMPDLVAPV